MRSSPQLEEASLTLLECVDMSPTMFAPALISTLFRICTALQSLACIKSPTPRVEVSQPPPYLALEDGVPQAIRLKEAIK